MGAGVAASGPSAALWRRAALLGILLLTAACAPTPKPQPASRPGSSHDVVVLLPDHEGKTGAIIVSGKGGKRLLSEPGQSVRVAAGGAPDKPVVMSRRELSNQVGPALSALPPPPLQFILFFRNDAAELTAESLQQVQQVVRTIRKRAPVDISVVGHTDTVGSRSYNHRLALKRSRAVAGLLDRK